MRKSYYGEKSGRLTIIDTRELFTREKALCRCECEAEKYIRVNDILRQTIQSCGCLQKEVTSKQRLIDLTNYKFGKLTVLSFSHMDNNKNAVWNCQCRCGNALKCNGAYLRNGNKTQCKECSSAYKNLVGKKFGLLTVISLSKKKYKDKRQHWNCKCECGNKITLSRNRLLSGNTLSCGCLKSKSEMNCKLILSKYKINFEPQKMFEGCVYKSKLKFDIYISSLNTCIELDGEQHFKPIKHFGGEKSFKKAQEKDAIKNKYCLDNNIELLRIPYTQFDNIEQILIDNKIIKR